MPNTYKNKVVYNGTTLIDLSGDTVTSADHIMSGYIGHLADGSQVTGTGSGGSSSGQTKTGTVTGDGTTTLQISCSFKPDLIYVHGDMSDAVSNRGVTSVTIIKDELIDIHSVASSSAVSESLLYVSHDVAGYNENDSSNPHASYSNGTLTIDMVANSAATRFRSGQVYTYELSTVGTGQGGGTPSATQHTIYFEFEDETDTTLTAYWDTAFISDAIRATTPRTYNNKTVTLAQLDNVTWYSYSPSDIPLNTQLIDFNAVTNDYVVSASWMDGEAFEFEWASVSDYTLIDPSMTFTYKGASQFDLCFYDSTKTFISGFNIGEDSGSSDQIATGTLTSSNIPSNAKYIRIDSFRNPDDTELSLIRTA